MKTITVVAGAILMLLAVGTAAAQETQPAGKAAAGTGIIKKQTICPIEGGQVNTNLFVDFGGKRVYFCCPGCPEEFKKDPAKHIAIMEKDGITLDKTPSASPAKKPTTGAAATPAHDPATR